MYGVKETQEPYRYYIGMACLVPVFSETAAGGARMSRMQAIACARALRRQRYAVQAFQWT